MIHRLGPNGAVIDHNTKTVFQIPFLGDFSSHDQQVTQKGAVVVLSLRQLSNWLTRDYQEMDGGLRVDIIKCDALQEI